MARDGSKVSAIALYYYPYKDWRWMPWGELPAFMSDLREREGVSTLRPEFHVTGGRGEVTRKVR